MPFEILPVAGNETILAIGDSSKAAAVSTPLETFQCVSVRTRVPISI
jgi:hypothetical protein